MTKPTEGTQYVVGGRYGQSYVDKYINGQMHGTVIGGTTKKNATEAANALNAAYRAGLNDAAQFIKEMYDAANPSLNTAKVISKEQLIHLDKTGRPCEVCGNHMHKHDWVLMDENGFVLRCSFIPITTESDI